jgi:hypothetical protein
MMADRISSVIVCLSKVLYLPVNLWVIRRYEAAALPTLCSCYYFLISSFLYKYRSRYNSVSIVTRLRAGRRGMGVRIPAVEDIALFSTAFTPSLERSQPANQCVTSRFHFTLFEWKWKSLPQWRALVLQLRYLLVLHILLAVKLIYCKYRYDVTDLLASQNIANFDMYNISFDILYRCSVRFSLIEGRILWWGLHQQLFNEI